MVVVGNRQDGCRLGFTLVEITIVLVIIGLLAGAIMAGATMIQNAKLQSMMGEVKKYNNAVGIFKDKYHYLPGDMPNATAFWGAGMGNGNGNGRIYGTGLGTGQATATDLPEEPFMVWQHLAAAGLITGTYSGTDIYLGSSAPDGSNSNPASWDCPKSLGLTCPLISYGGTMGTWGGIYGCETGAWQLPQFTDCVMPRLPPRHIMQYGLYLYSRLVTSPPGVLNGGDLLFIDMKMDDGLPHTGNVRTLAGWTNEPGDVEVRNLCLNNNDPATYALATYNSGYTNRVCPIFFIMDF